jgi:hypothetical protein
MVASEGPELYFTGSNTDSIKTAYYFSPLILTRDLHGSLHSDNCIAVHPSSIITAAICQRVRSVAFFFWPRNNTAASGTGFLRLHQLVNVERTSGTSCYGMTVSMPKHSKIYALTAIVIQCQPRGNNNISATPEDRKVSKRVTVNSGGGSRGTLSNKHWAGTGCIRRV